MSLIDELLDGTEITVQDSNGDRTTYEVSTNNLDVNINSNNITINTITKTTNMFKWSGLPETIPEYILETMLQCYGSVIITTGKDGKLYAFKPMPAGGPKDAYGRPQTYNVVNPYINTNKQVTLGVDAVLLLNDPYKQGITPLISKYSKLMAHTELSIYNAIKWVRAMAVISADGQTIRSVEDYLNAIEQGEMAVVQDNSFISTGSDGMHITPFMTEVSGSLKVLLEVEQYLKASLLNEIGLNANFNMKREALNSSESALNEEALKPLIDIYKKLRDNGANEINKVFNLNVSVQYNSAWDRPEEQDDNEDNDQQVEKEGDNMNNELLLKCLQLIGELLQSMTNQGGGEDANDTKEKETDQNDQESDTEGEE